MGDNVGSHTGLRDEAVEGEEVGVSGLAKKGSHDGVAGVNGGFAIGVNGVASVKRRFIEIILANQL